MAAVFGGNPNVAIRNTYMGREELTEERRDTIMEIWDASTRFRVVIPAFSLDLKSEYDGDCAWARLLQISKMTEEEFEAEWRKENEEGSESEGEDDGAEEEGQGGVEHGGEDDGEDEGAEEEGED